MSPGWLLLPFSELVLSSLSQLFVAEEGTARELAHWLPRDVCLSFQPRLCPSAPTSLLLPWLCSNRVVGPLESGKQHILKEGSLVFPFFFSFLPLIYKYQASKPMGNTLDWHRCNMQRWPSPRMRPQVDAGVKHFPMAGYEGLVKISQGIPEPKGNDTIFPFLF